MKDSLLEMLMSFFKESLSKLKETGTVSTTQDTDSIVDSNESSDPYDVANLESQTLFVSRAQDTSLRVLTYEEQMKLTKASQQLLMRLMLRNILVPETLELIINQLMFSESRLVTLQETKWAIRSTLAENLDVAQLAFLDLVLYQREDGLPLH